MVEFRPSTGIIVDVGFWPILLKKAAVATQEYQ
jgi:hypothetical protein